MKPINQLAQELRRRTTLVWTDNSIGQTGPDPDLQQAAEAIDIMLGTLRAIVERADRMDAAWEIATCYDHSDVVTMARAALAHVDPQEAPAPVPGTEGQPRAWMDAYSEGLAQGRAEAKAAALAALEGLAK